MGKYSFNKFLGGEWVDSNLFEFQIQFIDNDSDKKIYVDVEHDDNGFVDGGFNYKINGESIKNENLLTECEDICENSNMVSDWMSMIN